MIFQDPAASLNERATVDYIISEGLYNHHLFKDEEERKEKVKNIIREVGLLAEHLTRYPHEFSGGQRQRIGIAVPWLCSLTSLLRMSQFQPWMFLYVPKF
ncbi:oligopeptide transport ATP-binding protein AmiF [Streptococcus infantis SK1302]|uniref:Oligopeptide transport ATP-binding protein AmiF n=1 Tax=Streptococcus infantis SK1302 TaxID=871237 RepID=A0ABP2J597_9STRE|nr:oligopeptide transport ATP-binding protein AmiF [Streptococcus infantis SK1302]